MLGTLGGSQETLEGFRILKEALDVSSMVPEAPRFSWNFHNAPRTPLGSRKLHERVRVS